MVRMQNGESDFVQAVLRTGKPPNSAVLNHVSNGCTLSDLTHRRIRAAPTVKRLRFMVAALLVKAGTLMPLTARMCDVQTMSQGVMLGCDTPHRQANNTKS